jgi:hypothetical protein
VTWLVKCANVELGICVGLKANLRGDDMKFH